MFDLTQWLGNSLCPDILLCGQYLIRNLSYNQTIKMDTDLHWCTIQCSLHLLDFK